MVPVHNYPAGVGKSHAWRGAAYYVPSENRFVYWNYHNVTALK
jgi:hypothetical protein